MGNDKKKPLWLLEESRMCDIQIWGSRAFVKHTVQFLLRRIDSGPVIHFRKEVRCTPPVIFSRFILYTTERAHVTLTGYVFSFYYFAPWPLAHYTILYYFSSFLVSFLSSCLSFSSWYFIF